MKKIKLEVILEVEDNIKASDIRVDGHDVIDGFEITRNLLNDEDDVTGNFYLRVAKILKCEETE